MSDSLRSLADLRSAGLDIPLVWNWLNLPGKPEKCGPSPLRPDRKPSFSVYDGGQHFKDHATGEGGDVFDFIALALECPLPEAIRWAREKMGHAPPLPAGRRREDVPPATPAKAAPRLRPGTADELRALSALRCIPLRALQEAERRGLLAFMRHTGRAAWAVTDAERRLIEARRLDGRPWDAWGRLPQRKCHAWGTGKGWPVNLSAARDMEKIALVEGGPDLLAALAIILNEGAGDVCPVAMLGGANAIDRAALPAFRGKWVRLFPHADEAGRRAARGWALALRQAGAAKVDAYDLTGLADAEGRPGKDLNDFLRLGPEAFEAHIKFRNPLMP